MKRGLRVNQQVKSRKPHGVGVPEDVSESDRPSPALRGVPEVASPRVIAHIRFAAKPDVKTVKRMIKDRNVNADCLQHQHKRQPGQKLYLIAVGFPAVGGEGVGDEMLDQERADGDDSAEGMQSSE